MKLKSVVLLFLVFLIINGVIYMVTARNGEQRIQLAMNENLKTLQTHYEVLLHTQKITASTLYKSTVAIDKFIKIMSQAKNAGKKEKDSLRDELQKLLSRKYQWAKEKGVLQYHFIFPDNKVFLRMHKPSKFGDDLTDVRDDFRYTNKTKKPIRGFTQGRTAHGFRNTFPIFDKEHNHIGAMEVSFSSDSFQWSLNNISHIHTHFLVDKNIFESKAWKRDDLIVKYSQSAENQNYMVTLGGIHTKEKCIVENVTKLKPIKQEIEVNMSKGDKFSVYIDYLGDIYIVSFLPVKNLQDKAIAWLVSYEESSFIRLTLKNMLVMRISTFFISLILIYFMIRQMHSREIIKQRHKLLNDILDATDDIMFITNFKDVSFSNNRFKNLLNVKHSEEFNLNTNHNILGIFENIDGYLHAGLLNKNEHLISLIIKTPEDKRVVSIIDRHLKPKAFKISISKTNNIDDYLVTLSDITKMKEIQEITQEKAYIDGLTGIYNRNKFDEIMNEEMIRVKRFNHSLSLAILDIDKFKDFNDIHGHLIGDEVLIIMAQNVNKNIRETDTFARWGGEEFVILFSETSVNDAIVVSEKLRIEIEKLRHSTAGGITASFGITEYIEGDTIGTLFKRCDDALYKAKENGRNRVEVL